eukprot:CAMPEP_0172451818 /NCGR_PEP_ID=MMETSP1065-20121228/9692_1 /TAXON_ID=265537 /ORGANISM="Amphiprora paludosa, Strain CCMP125" /LENGTH=860 /DNA_ID=CAMNT_0013203789 /DNA_START=39 /DNA_END=2621 /DNA_ORIENTATION=+
MKEVNRHKLANAMKRVDFNKGDTIISKEDYGESLFVLNDGEVCRTDSAPSDESQRAGSVQSFFRGGCFGGEKWLEQRRGKNKNKDTSHAAGEVVARSAGSAYVIKRDEFEQIMGSVKEVVPKKLVLTQEDHDDALNFTDEMQLQGVASLRMRPLEKLSRRQTLRIQNILQTQKFDEGEIILEENEEVQAAIYFIYKGKVEREIGVFNKSFSLKNYFGANLFQNARQAGQLDVVVDATVRAVSETVCGVLYLEDFLTEFGEEATRPANKISSREKRENRYASFTVGSKPPEAEPGRSRPRPTRRFSSDEGMADIQEQAPASPKKNRPARRFSCDESLLVSPGKRRSGRRKDRSPSTEQDDEVQQKKFEMAARRAAEEEEAKERAEELERLKAEEEAQKKAEKEARRRRKEQEKRQKEEEETRLAAEAEAEAKRLRKEKEKARLAAEAEAKRLKEEEEKRRREEEEELRRLEEQEELRRLEEEAERIRLKEEKKRRAEEKRRIEEEEEEKQREKERLKKEKAKKKSRPTRKFEFHNLVKKVLLGEGQFGQVWLVTDKTENPAHSYALKIQSKYDLVAQNQAQVCVSEQQAMSKMDHANIIKLFASFQDTDFVYMLLEMANGGELFSLIFERPIDEDQFLPEDQARFYAFVIGDAMAYMHEQKYVFRDLKPENVLISNTGYPTIIDFGFAKIVEPSEKTFTLCGTPKYIPPEMILQQGHSYGADHWALGVVIYEMLCGENPFWEDGLDDMELYRGIIQDDYVKPTQGSSHAHDLIRQLLEKDDTRRLGNLAGGERDVTSHPWFTGLDLGQIQSRQALAPWVPPIKDEFDASCFDDWSELEDKTEQTYPPLDEEEEKLFAGFAS